MTHRFRRKHSGVSRLTIAAPGGPKIELAKSLDAADYYVPLDRSDPTPQWEQIKKDNPYGFDIGMCSTLFVDNWPVSDSNAGK